MQTTESSPPHHSESGLEINYAAGLLPNGGGLAPPVIGFHAPKTTSLLQGQMREPIPTDTEKKKRTKPSAVDPSATKKKKTKKQKTLATDDLPTVDPDVDKFLDDEAMEEDIDAAAAEVSDTREQTPPADTPAPQRIPPAPPQLARHPRVSILIKT